MLKTRRLRRAEASQYLKETHGVSRTTATLAKLATVGGGPKFQKLARQVYYDPADLDAWVIANLSAPRSSTSEAA
ncbi:MAG: hypothetical protein HQL37_06920 [Alphaproteobacteria bacterium]|nr:hypothetical protein [Alphaproteobacteria bacterium]